MDRKVKFYPREIVPSSDMTQMQDYVRQAFDDVVKYTLNGAQAYAGFLTVKTEAFAVSVAPGLYFASGQVYPSRSTLTQSLTTMQPLVNKVKIGVVVWGQTADDTPEYRNVVTNVETRATEAQLLMVRNARTAQIAFIKGVESTDPQPPTIPLDRLLVATITLTPTGIETVDMNIDTEQPSVIALALRTLALENWRRQAEPRIATIGSDVANLANAIKGASDTETVFRIAADVARLKDIAGLPDTYSNYGADRFLNTSETAVNDLDLLARVEEGIRYNWANQNVSALAVFNSINPAISQQAGILLPAFTSELRFSVTDFAGEQSISQYSQTSHTLVQRQMSRNRIRFGQSMNVCTNAQWWQSGNYDPGSGVFTRQGETWQVDAASRADALVNHRFIRVTQFWNDVWQEAYWEKVTTTLVVAGAQVAQSFLNTQAGWLTGVDLYFTKRGPSGNVNVAICELTDSGTPRLSRTIYQGTLAYLDMRTWPNVTTFPIAPTYLEAGKRYAVVLTTNGDHYVGMASGGAYLAGTFFYSTDGAYFAGDLTKDMMFGLRFARFANSRVVVDMQPLNLDGGISDIDILAGMIVPEATGLTFQVQVNSAWRPLSSISKDALVGLPPLLPLQVVFQGTPDIHAGIRLADSQVMVSRPRTTLKHISTNRLLPAATQTIRVIMTLAAWNPQRHTWTQTIRTAGGTFNPSVVQDIDLGNGRLQRTFRYQLATGITQFQIINEATTTTALDTQLAEERVDIEF